MAMSHFPVVWLGSQRKDDENAKRVSRCPVAARLLLGCCPVAARFPLVEKASNLEGLPGLLLEALDRLIRWDHGALQGL